MPVTIGNASEWAVQYASYLAYFAIMGAIGFRCLVLPRWRDQAAPGQAVFEDAAGGAAGVGLGGALLHLADIGAGLARSGLAPDRRGHSPLADAALPLAFGLLLLLAFGLARRRVPGAWAGAGLIGLAFALRELLGLRLSPAVNAVHMLAGSCWLGTLFALVAAGLPAIVRSQEPPARNWALFAALVSKFSPVALVSAGILALTGVITAWLHLKYLAALWTTPYGLTLLVKLCAVAGVVALGAWNWRRLTPVLGAEAGSMTLRRSATRELALGALVLAITSVLVILPSPRLPGASARPDQPAPGAGSPGKSP